MLMKLVLAFAFVLLILPPEPDLGMGTPTAFLPIEIEHIQTALFVALDKVRADLKANGGVKRLAGPKAQ